MIPRRGFRDGVRRAVDFAAGRFGAGLRAGGFFGGAFGFVDRAGALAGFAAGFLMCEPKKP
jgi:hypothetical protein